MSDKLDQKENALNKRENNIENKVAERVKAGEEKRQLLANARAIVLKNIILLPVCFYSCVILWIRNFKFTFGNFTTSFTTMWNKLFVEIPNFIGNFNKLDSQVIIFAELLVLVGIFAVEIYTVNWKCLDWRKCLVVGFISITAPLELINLCCNLNWNLFISELLTVLIIYLLPVILSVFGEKKL